MPTHFSKEAGPKRTERIKYLQAYLEAYSRRGKKAAAYREVAEKYGITKSKIQELVRRWQPGEGTTVRMHGHHKLSLVEEMTAVGLILGMANISKPLDIKSFLKIMNKRHKSDGKKLGRDWSRGFLQRWSNFVSLKKTQLISVGRSRPDNLGVVEAFVQFQADFNEKFYQPAKTTFNVDESRVSVNEAKKTGKRLGSATFTKGGTKGKRDKQYCSVIPFINALGETISVFYVLPTTPGQTEVHVPTFTSARDGTAYREYYLMTSTGYTNDTCFVQMMAQFEKDFHLIHPGLRAVVYMDRLGSHCTGELLSTLEGKQVWVVLLPAGTTQFLQPLDDAVFALFKKLLLAYRDEDMNAEPLQRGVQDHTLLSAMLRALKESLKPAVIKTSFARTGIYPWNPELILSNARAAFPNADSVGADLPSPTKKMIVAIIEATPRSKEVAVTPFRKHRLESSQIFILDDFVARNNEYYENKEKEEADRRKKAREKKEAAEKRHRDVAEQKKIRLEEREEKKRRKEQENEEKAKRARQSKCHFCEAAWKASTLWLWCDDCDDYGYCPKCQKDPDRTAAFDQHEAEHENL